jgi:ferredoxin
LLVAILGMALAGSLTLLALDPLTLLLRALASAIWPGLDKLVTALETALYPLPGMGRVVSIFDSWVRPALLPSQPVGSRAGWLFAAILLGIVALNAWAPRFWCRYLCPLGGLLGLLSRVAIFKRTVNDECSACGLCESTCPTGTIDPQRGYTSDPAECTLCMDCLEACHRSGIRFPGRFATLAEAQPYDPGRRQALAAFGLALAGAALAVTGDSNRERHPFLLQPPGGLENDLTSRCIRCGACVRACPTGGLQPALAEAGLEGLWTPVLAPRLGYCDYSCNACGQVCPVQAIPPLSLDEKRQQVIGVAAIDRDRCIAWSGQGECIICEEMCPVPQKAVYLEEADVAGRDGQTRQTRRGLLPHVEAGMCIGCGICEYRCPVVGPAAIRVYAKFNQ